MAHKARTLALLGATIGVALIACAPVRGPDGHAAFQRLCSGCHGETGGGDGEMAIFVRGGVPNLRELSRRNGGTFPEARVVAVITRSSDFHSDVIAMPDFGDLLSTQPTTYVAPDGQKIETDRAVLNIVAYLSTIQS